MSAVKKAGKEIGAFAGSIYPYPHQRLRAQRTSPTRLLRHDAGTSRHRQQLKPDCGKGKRHRTYRQDGVPV